jgi:hypothetical protein
VHDARAGDLVDDRQRDAGRRRADDGVGAGVQQVVGLLGRDVGGAVAGVGTDLLDGLAVDTAGFVDLLDREVDPGELRRAEEGEVAGLGQQRAHDQGAVALGGASAAGRFLVWRRGRRLVSGGLGFCIGAAACREHEGAHSNNGCGAKWMGA